MIEWKLGKAARLPRLWRSRHPTIGKSGLANGRPVLTSGSEAMPSLPSHELTTSDLIRLARAAARAQDC